jgi:hypothetical protein
MFSPPAHIVSPPHNIWVDLHSLYYQENAFTFHAQLRKVMHLDAAGSDISAFIQQFEKESALLVRLTASSNQSTNESRQYRKDFETFPLYDRAKRDFLWRPSWIDILTKSIIFRLRMSRPSRRSKTNSLTFIPPQHLVSQR